MQRNKKLNKNNTGFTLIELLVVIAIIALLSSVALIALMSARAKSREAKRVADMVQSNNALELYFTLHRGYPTNTGVPADLVPTAASTLPNPPLPADGICGGVDFSTFNPAIPVGTMGDRYYYLPSGTAYIGSSGALVAPDYEYHFCLGATTGNLPPGHHVLTPRGLR